MMPGLGRRRLTWRDLPEAERAHAAGRELRKRPLAASVAPLRRSILRFFGCQFSEEEREEE